MSNKTQLQTNNTALDGYIARINAAKEVAAGLPEAGGGGSGGGTISVTVVNNSSSPVYYWDADKILQTVGIGITHTVNALNGVLYLSIYSGDVFKEGTYVESVYGSTIIIMFLADGGYINYATGSGGGN